jgi:hypothetical protein
MTKKAKRTSIGKSANSRTTGKDKRRKRKRSRGQGGK